jgi:hypothetical protein
MKPLEKQSVDRTLLGIVPSLNSLFEAYAYCRQVQLGKHSGTHTIHPPGYFFLSSETESIKTWGDDQLASMFNQSLYVKPHPGVRRIVERYCTSRINGASDDYIGSFKIIAWEPYGHALVVASDSNMIANPWVAFVSLASLPTINLTTTEIYTP